MPKLKFTPLPLKLIQESLVISETSPTFLCWKERPLHHFQNERRWRQANSRGAGKMAGHISYETKCKRFIGSVELGGQKYQLSRVIYALFHGKDPGKQDIDHIDGDRSNNHPSNLRAIPHHLNCHNRRLTRTSKCGATGVSWNRHVGKFIACIRVKGKSIHLGCFDSVEDAAAARLAAEERYIGQHSYRKSRGFLDSA